MRNIFLLVRHDFRRVTRNVVATVVLFGVVVIPSFFAWFNVLSSWDPFSNVKNLKVAVANADEGYQSDLFPMRVNIGEQVISTLRANSDLNWVFTSSEDAIEGTKSEEFYAALVLPENFSQEMMTFLGPEAKPIQIEYYTNEKKNALSPKITDEAATEVSTKINEAFTKTVNEVGLATISSLADYLQDPETRAALTKLESSVREASTQLDAGAETLDMFSMLLGSSKVLVTSASSLATSSVDALDETAGAVGQGIDSARSLKSVLDSTAGSLERALASSAGSYRDLVKQVDALYASLDKGAKDASTVLDKLADRVDTQVNDYQDIRDRLQEQADATSVPALREALEVVITRLDGVIDQQKALRDRITKAAKTIAAADTDSKTARKEITALAHEVRRSIDDARKAYSGSLKPKLERLAGTLGSINSSFSSIERDLDGAASALAGGTDSTLGALIHAEEITAGIADDFRKAATDFDRLASALDKAATTGDLGELTKIIGSNPEILAGELTSPVGLKRIAVFKVDTFGAQMAPFYTVLGLWVGALLLSVLIRTDVPPGSVPFAKPPTHTQEYLGRYGIFATLALLQSSLLYGGLIGFVGVRPAYPMLLILAGWVMSLVFSLITYTLVLSFGEAGKATAVFLLVVQISAGGGAYPLSVLPQWFQNISPFLPVTHATNAVRAAIAGIYENDYWISLGQLALFILPALLIGLVLRLPVLKLNNDLARALESTKLM